MLEHSSICVRSLAGGVHTAGKLAALTRGLEFVRVSHPWYLEHMISLPLAPFSVFRIADNAEMVVSRVLKSLTKHLNLDFIGFFSDFLS